MSQHGERQYAWPSIRAKVTKTCQMAIPFFHFMLKEVTAKCAFAYTDQDFKETVDAFLAGKNAL